MNLQDKLRGGASVLAVFDSGVMSSDTTVTGDYHLWPGAAYQFSLLVLFTDNVQTGNANDSIRVVVEQQWHPGVPTNRHRCHAFTDRFGTDAVGDYYEAVQVSDQVSGIERDADLANNGAAGIAFLNAQNLKSHRFRCYALMTDNSNTYESRARVWAVFSKSMRERRKLGSLRRGLVYSTGV